MDIRVPFEEKDEAKALGARWSGERRTWYIPEGKDPQPFGRWLPEGALTQPTGTALSTPTAALPATPSAATELATSAPKGMALSQLLQGVEAVVRAGFPRAVWVRVEVVNVKTGPQGHVYFELAERAETGTLLAKANGMMWAGMANKVLPAFKSATGIEMAAGLKLLVQAQPKFSAQYGLSLELTDIDPNFSLGELESRKRQIREQLKRLGVFDLQRSLAAPWDFTHVLVVSPADAAGLGDFQAEAMRLASAGVCHFTYVHAVFQGERACADIRENLAAGLVAHQARFKRDPDAVVIIRGGGAVNDLAWLNDFELSKLLCELPIPVLTGIGHERDSVLLDEVAHQRFDTPSKVIKGIEAVIVSRVREAQSAFELITGRTQHECGQAAKRADNLRTQILTASQQSAGAARSRADAAFSAAQRAAAACVSLSKDLTAKHHTAIAQHARTSVRDAERLASHRQSAIREAALAGLNTARQTNEQTWASVQQRALQVLADARTQSTAAFAAVAQTGKSAAAQWRLRADQAHGLTLQNARRHVVWASDAVQGLFREIVGQGPQKTLSRGFALVRTDAGGVIAQAGKAQAGQSVRIELADGQLSATVTTITRKEQP